MKTGLEVVVYTFFGGKMLLSLPSSLFFFSWLSKWLEEIDGMQIFEV